VRNHLHSNRFVATLAAVAVVSVASCTSRGSDGEPLRASIVSHQPAATGEITPDAASYCRAIDNQPELNRTTPSPNVIHPNTALLQKVSRRFVPSRRVNSCQT
jgi:hypothetical protein